ncbi:MAG: acyl-CoA carboxylase subunit beta [Candidatus Latescibacteria bacterium]|jgi:acetyl-CoA carboxylase carboxyltransferase component|nr:acyl-CoA carboxylase subunit beta [Candidatus Latescibacterota bacterium]
MAPAEDNIEKLERKLTRIQEMGGADQVAKQHEKGKMTARERIDLFFDEGTFNETDAFVRHRSTYFGLDKQDIPGDGVITGYGLVHGRRVFAYFQDFTCRGGTLGEMHARKICKVMDKAAKAGVPVVGFNDSGGARIQEGIDALGGFGDIFFRNARSSGVIPQISVIMGPCAGGAVYSPAMTDWIFMVKNTSYMYITGPDVIKTVTGEKTTHEELGGAIAHNTKNGNAHFACEDEKDAINSVKTLLSFIPDNNMEDAPCIAPTDDPRRMCPELNSVIPEDGKTGYDMKDVIHSIVDHGAFFEPHQYYAENIITCLARLNGCTVGIIANQPQYLAGCLDINASDKASRFIRTCDAFNIPLITLVDVPGYLPGTDQEWGGVIRHGAKLLWSYSEATVPKLTVITRKAYGGAYIAMCSCHLGADTVLAWPSAEIAVMGAEGAVNIIYRRDLEAARNPDAIRSKLIKEYEDLLYNPYVAANRGFVDAVINPEETRARLIEALEAMRTKNETLPPKKHGNIPL